MIPNKITAIRVRNKRFDNSQTFPVIICVDTYSLQEYGGSGKAFDITY